MQRINIISYLQKIKMKLIVLFALIGLAMCQDVAETDGDYAAEDLEASGKLKSVNNFNFE